MLMQRIDLDGSGGRTDAWDGAWRAIWEAYRPPLYAAGTWRLQRRAMRLAARYAPGGPHELDVDALVRLREDLLAGVGVSRPLAPAGVNSVLRSLRAMIGVWEDAGLAARNPFRAGGRGRRGRLMCRVPRRLDGARHHSIEEMQRLFQRADAEFAEAASIQERFRRGRRRALLYVLAYAGLRKSEALWLRWSHVDHARGVLWVLEEDRVCKTAGSAGPVPLAARLADALEAWRPLAGGRYVLPQMRDRDRPWTQGKAPYRPTDDLQALGRRAGVHRLTMQSLRRTWATHAESAWGLSYEQQRRVLRHTTVATGDWYREADLPNLRRLAERIDYGR